MNKHTRVRFLDLKVIEELERSDILQAFQNHLDTGRFLVSDSGDDFETRFASIHGRSLCVGFNTGTDALSIAIRLLDIKPDSYIITSPFSWIASSSSILLNGLHPLYVDVDNSLQIDLDAVEDLLKSSSLQIPAILVPHLHGNVSNLATLERLRDNYNVKIIEDCAQSYAARDGDGRLSGSIGDISAFSFNPMKVLGAFGDAGAIIFDDESYLARARSLRHSGLIGSRGLATEISTNCRIDALQASILRVRLDHFEAKLSRRREICNQYNSQLSHLLKPITSSIDLSNHYCYQTLCDNRDNLMKHLINRGVEARIRHDFLIPDHPAFIGSLGCYPNAQRLVKKTLCLPMHHHLSASDVDYVIHCVKSFYNA